MVTQDDIRYRAHCLICNKPLGDWALKVKEPLCYDHKKWDLKKEVRTFEATSN